MLTSAIILSVTMVIECILFMEYKRKYARQPIDKRSGNRSELAQ